MTDTIGPATVGVWRSRVLLPRWVLALPGAQRQYVLRHEEEHRSAHDARLLFVTSLTLLLLPWNLALWWQLWRLRLAIEVDCDNRVVSAPTPLRHVQRFLVPAMAIALLFVVLSMPHPVLGGSRAHATTKSGNMTTSPGLHPAPESSAANRP